jgi:hypothetical protein
MSYLVGTKGVGMVRREAKGCENGERGVQVS